MEDYRLDQSGQEVQDILNGAAMQVDLTAETERATEAEQTLQGNIDAEATRAQGAEGTLQDNIDAEEARAKAAEKQNADDIDAIEEKIPSGASSSNKLATEEYVADAVATATATFRGTYNLVSDLHLNVTATEQQIAAALAGAISTADNNDYCFILVPTSSETPTEIKEIDRYKFNGTAWAFEYKLNNSGFTAAQWAAINSGITSGDVAKLAALPTNAQLTTLLAGLQSDIDGEETRAKGAEGTLQDNIDAEETRAKAAEKQNADDIDAIEAVLPENASSENKVATESEINSLSAAIEAILLLIPSAATSLNKLADKAFVNSSIATATATFRGTYNLVNDLGLTTSATHAQIATALAGAILTADNNDYAFVQIPTSDAMPTEIAKTERYKFNGTAWEYEYDLNNSGFTADQWAAINSGITQALVTKLAALPTNAELTTELGTLTSGITAINQKIPSAASQANKLVDTAAMESYIVQVLDVLTISYNVTSTDDHVTLSIEQVDGKITSVALTTSDIASAAALNLKASQADLTALASRVTTAEGNITTLGGRMTTAEGNITSLGGRMTTAEGNITSLGGRVSTNETDIANLQQLYNDLQQSKPVPVTALPSTGQQQGVIYRLAGTTSYSDYMWNGSTWVLMATYNNAIDPRPKKASQNLVTSGGVFDNMGALDVSELNATENPHTLAQYIDLSAALAAIPTDYQKGGMSIKFVQSSDNKYVQFRFMLSTFTSYQFVDTSNWQGVDDAPIAESNNLIKSGGVLKANVDNFIHTNEYTATSTGFKEIPCGFHKGDKVFVKVGNGAAISEIRQRPIMGSSEGDVLVDTVQTEDGYYFIATIDFESIRVYCDSAGTITIERDAINKDVNAENLKDNIKTYLYPKVSKALTTSPHFNEIPFSALKGDRVFVRLSNGAEIGDMYLRPELGSSTGQQIVTNKVSTADGFYFIATIDFESIYTWCEVAGNAVIERDNINRLIKLEDIPFDFSKLMYYKQATPDRIFEGPYPNYNAKILQGSYWGTYIFDVRGCSKVKVVYANASSAYGIAFSVSGDTVENFNIGTNSDWWSQYPNASGEIEVNVPVGANYLALTQSGMSNECYLYLVYPVSSSHINPYYGKKCIYIGDSISTQNNYYWKGLIEEQYNVSYVRDGAGLHPADGGIPLMPYEVEPASDVNKSIWYRCAQHRMDIYNFDIISLFGGTNDMNPNFHPEFKVGDVNANGEYLDIADIIPYVDDADSFDVPSDYNDVFSYNLTYAEGLKGCIEMLHRDFPTKPIVICTVLPCSKESEYGGQIYVKEGSPINGLIMSERMAILAMRIAEWYFRKGWNVFGVPFYWGVRTVENVAAFSAWLYSQDKVDGVHPNRIAAIRMMNMFKDSLMM